MIERSAFIADRSQHGRHAFTSVKVWVGHRPGQTRLWMGVGAIVAFAPISGSDLCSNSHPKAGLSWPMAYPLKAFHGYRCYSRVTTRTISSVVLEF